MPLNYILNNDEDSKFYVIYLLLQLKRPKSLGSRTDVDSSPSFALPRLCGGTRTRTYCFKIPQTVFFL